MAAAQAGQPVQHHVDLHLRALGTGDRRRPSPQPVEHGGRHPREHVGARHGPLAVPVPERGLGVPPVGRHGGHLRPGDQVGAGGPGRALQRPGDRAHAAHGHPPLAGPVADHVVEEAAVLEQVALVRRGERPDQGIGQHHAPHGVVPERGLDGLAQRPGHEPVPQVFAHSPVGLGRARERLEESGRHRPGHPLGVGVEAAPGVVLGVRPGQLPERRRGGGPRVPLDEKAQVTAIATHRGERGDSPRPQAQVEVELGHDAVGQQADQVRVARQPGVHPGEHPPAHRGPAHVPGPFQHAHRQPRKPQVRRRHEGVVPPAHHHDVVAVGHDRRPARST
jgi:hypothetical protein